VVEAVATRVQKLSVDSMPLDTAAALFQKASEETVLFTAMTWL
jgi:hypothetical protein